MNSVRQTVAFELLRKQTQNPRYSLRAYSRDLGISPAALSLFLRGKRNLSVRSKKKILSRIGLPDTEVGKMIKSCSSNDYEAVDAEKYKLLSGWQHFAILSLAECEDFCSDPSWIAKRLGITRTLTEDSISRLVALGMIVKDASSGLRLTGKQFSVGSTVKNLAIRRSHMQNLDLAKESGESDPIEKRDLSMMTMAIDPGKLPEASRRLKRFRRGLAKWLESGSKKEVYRLSIQLFPLSKEAK